MRARSAESNRWSESRRSVPSVQTLVFLRRLPASINAFCQTYGNGRRLTLVLLLNEAQNIEVLDFALREETVDRVLLVGENLKHRRELGQQQQFDVALV